MADVITWHTNRVTIGQITFIESKNMSNLPISFTPTQTQQSQQEKKTVLSSACRGVHVLLKGRLPGVPGRPEGEYFCERVTCKNTHTHKKNKD